MNGGRMIGTESKHCQIVRDALRGKRPISDETYVSLAILDERLEQLKKYDKMFTGVRFSSAVRKLIKQDSRIPVG
jgi:hypothetical protein